MTATTPGRLRHVHATDEGHRVTTLELFFDLVFVSGLTQVTARSTCRTAACRRVCCSPSP